MKTSRKILVTGGLGFVGSHLVESLLQSGYSVRVVDNIDPQVHLKGKPEYAFLDQVEWIQADIRDPDIWGKLLEDVDCISHQASAVGVVQSQYEITKYCDVNVMGTAHMLDYLANHPHQVKKIIVASSMSSYGEGRYINAKGEIVRPSLRTNEDIKTHGWEPLCPKTQESITPQATHETDERMPTSVYSINKMTQEDLVHCFGNAYGIPTTSLRYFNIFGPRQSLSNPYAGVLAIFISRLKNSATPVVYEDGNQSRDFVHVTDIVKANLLSLEKDFSSPQSFNIGSGISRSILSISKNISEMLNPSIETEITYSFRKGDVRHCFASIEKAQKLLGYSPQVSFEKGLQDLAQWSEQQEASDQFEKAQQELKVRKLL